MDSDLSTETDSSSQYMDILGRAAAPGKVAVTSSWAGNSPEAKLAQTVLITGSTSAVGPMADAVRAAGATPIVAQTPDELTAAIADLEEGGLEYYIQLPSSIRPSGSTVTKRVHEFLVEGLLERYRAAEVVLPVLADTARVVLVSGNVNTETSAPDDRAARLSLVHVLKHAMRADKSSSTFDIEVAVPNTEPDVVVRSVLNGTPLEPEETEAPKAAAVDPGLDYFNWRIEMLGAMRSEF